LSISHLNNTYCAGKANEYGTLSYYLEKEKKLLQKVHQNLLTQIKDVAGKLYTHDSKALTIPGQTLTLPQFLDSIVKEANKNWKILTIIYIILRYLRLLNYTPFQQIKKVDSSLVKKIFVLIKDIILPTIKPEDIVFDNKDNDGKYKLLGGENF